MEVPVDSAPLPREGHHSSSTPSSSVTILEDHHRHLQLEQLQRMHDLQMTESSALETALSTYTADVADVVDDAPAEAATEGAPAELPAAVGAASSPSTKSLESTMQDLQREVNYAASDVRTAQQRFQKQQQDDLERFQREETALVAKMARLVKVLDEAKQKVETEKEARRQEEIEAERVAAESRRLQFEDSLTRQSVTITLSSDRLNKLQAAMEKLRLSKQPSSVASDSAPAAARNLEKAPVAAAAAPPPVAASSSTPQEYFKVPQGLVGVLSCSTYFPRNMRNFVAKLHTCPEDLREWLYAPTSEYIDVGTRHTLLHSVVYRAAKERGQTVRDY